jgi:hypothetical protein
MRQDKAMERVVQHRRIILRSSTTSKQFGLAETRCYTCTSSRKPDRKQGDSLRLITQVSISLLLCSFYNIVRIRKHFKIYERKEPLSENEDCVSRKLPNLQWAESEDTTSYWNVFLPFGEMTSPSACIFWQSRLLRRNYCEAAGLGCTLWQQYRWVLWTCQSAHPGSQFELVHSDFEHTRSSLRRRESFKNASSQILSQKLRPKVMHLWSVFTDCIGHTCLNFSELASIVDSGWPDIIPSPQTDGFLISRELQDDPEFLHEYQKRSYRYSRIRGINISNSRESYIDVYRSRVFWSGKLDACSISRTEWNSDAILRGEVCLKLTSCLN